ncbi:MAG: phosphotransferase [Sphingomicrobium sp.]
MTDFFASPEALPMPLTPEAVTARWLTAALRERRPGVTVAEAQVVDIIWGTSTKIRVRVRCEGPGSEDLPPTLIVKGGFEEHSRRLGPMYANEVRFYADILPFVSLPSPACYFAASDPDSYQSIVIMEDLKRDGVVFCDALKPHSFEQVAYRMDVMAAFHAETWQSVEFEEGGRWADIGSRFETWGLDFQRRYLVPDVWAHYLASPRGAAASVMWHDRDWMEYALARIGEIQFAQPRCMIHGDTHLGNLFISGDGNPGFFDAQVARTAWHHEVSYHMVCALDQADRRRWEGALLERYLVGLRANGIDAPDFEAAWLDYRRSMAWGLFIFLTNEVRFQTESVNTAYAARFSAAALDHDLKRLLA